MVSPEIPDEMFPRFSFTQTVEVRGHEDNGGDDDVMEKDGSEWRKEAEEGAKRMKELSDGVCPKKGQAPLQKCAIDLHRGTLMRFCNLK